MGSNFFKKTGAKRQIAKLNESLLDAIKNGDLSEVKAALGNGVDVNAKNDWNWTALMSASENGHTEIVYLLKNAGAKK